MKPNIFMKNTTTSLICSTNASQTLTRAFPDYPTQPSGVDFLKVWDWNHFLWIVELDSHEHDLPATPPPVGGSRPCENTLHIHLDLHHAPPPYLAHPLHLHSLLRDGLGVFAGVLLPAFRQPTWRGESSQLVAAPRPRIRRCRRIRCCCTPR